ncbi:Z1 domain-containing protein [Catellatospora vulcania]|uniref:Z1 domain-containing protein n=1 Tax=Catellatospora vulcania TaxID=1460450 RepID=UPI0012D46339|nr:Z1 domain-containing protein [Catellatospora vulcania]
MTDAVAADYLAALKGMKERGVPRPLHVAAAALSDDPAHMSDGAALLDHLNGASSDDRLKRNLQISLSGWDAQPDASWAEGTQPHTRERRAVVYRRLSLDDAAVKVFDDMFVMFDGKEIIVIDDPSRQQAWRRRKRQVGNEFYWDHYSEYLLRKPGWADGAVHLLDAATEQVLERLSDPTDPSATPTKGLVVGYVQSGKTANFTGVITKAIDAGYRLVIVLAGTTNLLRNQTQRRLDMELVGRENLEREISADDPTEADYFDDPDWISHRFIEHGGRPSDVPRLDMAQVRHPDIDRLTTYRWDYKRLRNYLTALDYRRDVKDRQRPFYDPQNLFNSDTRLLVVKKNALVLKDLVKDLKRHTGLEEVPVLMIDDESDQASVNTVNPRRLAEDGKDRTAINKLIGDLLRLFPRAQYVGYTATPFANVFVNPDDDEDIFPRDFLISLPPPADYMGAAAFTDRHSDIPLTERSYAESNERKHVRLLPEADNEEDLRQAIDMYVLTGAIKIYRERRGLPRYRHHTMLVHEDRRTAVQKDQADLIKSLWKSGGYRSPGSLARLRRLFEDDIELVSRASGLNLPVPSTFEELVECLGEALDLMDPPDPDAHPVLLINSDKDAVIGQEELQFDKRRVWRILVGGNKLARGFTVEGLTISFYRRDTTQTDTLLQMGRWFGFRPGYRDLVRLYTTPELHEKFGAACLDEEQFRFELERYAELDVDGKPQVTPRQIPPLVYQHLPQLKPTASNKMFNAQLAERRSPGLLREPKAYALEEAQIRANTQAFEPLLALPLRSAQFLASDPTKKFNALVGHATHAQVIAALAPQVALSKAGMPDGHPLQADFAWLRSLSAADVTQWVIMFPKQGAMERARRIMGHGPFVVVTRTRNGDRLITRSASGRHVDAAMRIAGVDGLGPDPQVNQLRAGRTGALLLYPSVLDPVPPGSFDDSIDPGKVTMCFSVIAPASARPNDGRAVTFSVRDGRDEKAVVVDARVDV